MNMCGTGITNMHVGIQGVKSCKLKHTFCREINMKDILIQKNQNTVCFIYIPSNQPSVMKILKIIYM